LAIPTENHHPNRKKYPLKTIAIPLKDHHKIHGTIPIDSEIARVMRQYHKLTQLLVMVKNWKTAFVKEFGDASTLIDFGNIKAERVILVKKAKTLCKTELSMVKIKGISTVYIAYLMAFADPKRFPSQRKFLHYCGYTASARKTNKYSRKMHSIGYQMVKRLLMAKNLKYSQLYALIKAQFASKFPDYSKGKIDGLARNRVGTFLFKELYSIFRAEKNSEAALSV